MNKEERADRSTGSGRSDSPRHGAGSMTAKVLSDLRRQLVCMSHVVQVNGAHQHVNLAQSDACAGEGSGKGS